MLLRSESAASSQIENLTASARAIAEAELPGGHAKRNEFQAGGRMILGYGGSEAFQSPKHLYSDTVNNLLKLAARNADPIDSALGIYAGLFAAIAVPFVIWRIKHRTR